MSRPIAIPVYRPSHASQRSGRSHINRRPFNCGSGPFFGLVEVFENGKERWLLSAGDGKYINVKPYHQLPPLVFAVERNLSKRSLSIKIVSDELKRVLTQCLRQRLAPPINPKLDLDTLLRSYDTLKLKLQLANATEPQNEGVKELALLLDGFLLDRTVYDGIGLNSFKNRGVLTMSFLQDLHRRTAHRGLRDIGECLVLGKISDEEVGARLNDIRDKIAYFTQTGDFNNLQVLCEASVMAGEVDILYNQAILRKALDNNHYDIYEYLLDLMARSQNSPTDTPQSNLPDITYDPMYNAIRLGHLSTVENLVTEGTFFEGFAPGEGIPDGHILAPLSAAVLWHQTEIVQCLIKSLLKTGLLYYAGYHQAMEWARTPEMKELLRTIPDQDQLYDIRGPLRSLMLNTPEASKHRSPAPTPDLLPHLGHRQTEQAINSVSALSAGLANIATAPFELSYEFCPGLCVDSYSEIDAWRQERPADHIPPYSPPSSQSPLASPQATECPPPCLDDLREDGSREFVLITKSYTNRRKMGCSVLQNLGTQGLKVLRNMSDRDTFDTTGFSDVDTLWREGLQGWELLLTNVPLPNLTQVLQCLLVADALANYMTLQGQESLLQYVPILASSLYVSDNKPRSLVDASVWREILPKTDQGLFAEIIASTWEENNCEFPCTTWDQETDYIRPLMQCIVGVDHVSHQPAGLASTGRRLPALTEIDWKTSNCHDEATAHHNFRYIDSRLCRLSIDEDDSQVDLFGLKDLIDIDKLQQDMLFERPRIYGAFIRGLPPTAQINVHSAVAQALSSAAFSWVLAMILVLNGRPREKILDAVTTARRHGCPAEFLETFLDMDESLEALPSLQPLAQPYAAVGSSSGSHLLRMVAACASKTKEDQGLDAAASLGGSFSDSTSTVCTLRGASLSDLSTSFLSSSPETARRLKCQFPRCDKTFSSVSNRNKHMKEGCSFRDKRGYRCRNPGCDKLVTTKWYRNTHEQERCRYRLT